MTPMNFGDSTGYAAPDSTRNPAGYQQFNSIMEQLKQLGYDPTAILGSF
jgi:hypothetical protein